MKSPIITSMDKKIGLIVYARTGSKRFPNKVTTNIYQNKKLLEIILEKLKTSKFNHNIIVATTDKKRDKKIINICKSYGVEFFRGSENNVFLRTQKCIKRFKLDYFARICGDRPLLDVVLMDKMIKLILKKKYDIVTNALVKSYPKGLTCEVANCKIFKNINSKSLLPSEKEHLFNFFYKKKRYKIVNLKKKFNKKFININFSIDTKNDLKRIKKIISNFDRKKLKLSSSNLYRLYK